MKKDTLIIIVIIVIGTLMYGLTLRGDVGNAPVDQFKENLDKVTNAFELSPERGRYVHVVALAERGEFDLTREWADVAYPDVGFSQDGRFYSYFAPGVAYLTTPFYMVGSKFNLGQVATFSAESLVSIITLVFIFLIGRRIFLLPRWAAFFAVLVYGFASTSWSYAITLYQNAFTTCLIVTAFYAAWRFSQGRGRHNFLFAGYVWFAYALGIFVDYPNAILMLPIMVYLAVSTFTFRQLDTGFNISVRYAAIVMSIVFVLITGLHLWHNTHYYGAWNEVAGGLRSMKTLVEAEGRAAVSGTGGFLATTTVALGVEELTPGIATSSNEVATPTAASVSSSTDDKDVVAFFHEEKMPHGLYILLFSDERGLFFFTPIYLFALLGIAYIIRSRKDDLALYVVPLALVAVNLFLYSSWGDPWGGTAFGPRYLIPSMPWLALFVALALYRSRSNLWKGLAFVLFLYSSAIALLAALTTNTVPTKGEGLLLPAKAYNWLYNLPFLENSQSGSFAYRTFFSDQVTLIEYYIVILLYVAIVAGVTLFYASRQSKYE